jgi:GT2 family glycosyltransferase
VNRWTALYSEKNSRERIECDYVIGCCWLLNRAAFENLGDFDRDYYINHWEVDYCLRCKGNGYRVIYEPRVIAKHKIPFHRTISEERTYYLYRNKLLLIIKNSAFFRGLWVVFLCLATSLGKLPFLIFSHMNWAQIKRALRGLFDGLRRKTGPIFRED